MLFRSHNRPFYAAVAEHVHLVAISDAQRADNPEVAYLGTVHNGIDLTSYPMRTDKDGSLVYIGRANPDKGPVEAIEVARRAGRPLQMILKRSEPPEAEYFAREIEPHLGSDVTLHENVDHATKVDLLGRASAMIFPIRWPEPFGLVMAVVALVGYGLAPGLLVVLILLVIHAPEGFVHPALTALMSHEAPEDAQGEIQGGIASLQNIGMIAGTLLFAMTFGWFMKPNPIIVSADVGYFLSAAILAATLAYFLARGPGPAATRR